MPLSLRVERHPCLARLVHSPHEVGSECRDDRRRLSHRHEKLAIPRNRRCGLFEGPELRPEHLSVGERNFTSFTSGADKQLNYDSHTSRAWLMKACCRRSAATRSMPSSCSAIESELESELETVPSSELYISTDSVGYAETGARRRVVCKSGRWMNVCKSLS